jgi:predicted aspartyl protease
MTTRIDTVQSTAGSKRITFTLTADAAGAHETVSTTINGHPYSTQVDVGAGDHSGLSIAHNEAGRYTVRLRAETSNVSSADYTLDL